MEFTTILQKATIEGGKVVASYFRKDVVITQKTSIHDVVSKVDHEAQNAIVTSIKSSFKNTPLEREIGFIGEEGLHEPNTYTFVMDPLDGTAEFLAGIDVFGTSVGLFKEGELFAGTVYDPIRKNAYTAEKGKGAYKNNKRFKIPQGKKLKEAMVLYSLPRKSEQRKQFAKLLYDAFPYVRGMRSLGSIAMDLCRVASGVGDIVIRGRFLNLWDIAGGRIVLDEAGGTMRDWDGVEVQFDMNQMDKRYELIAGTPHLVEEFINLATKLA